jgi:hypothetical protein
MYLREKINGYFSERKTHSLPLHTHTHIYIYIYSSSFSDPSSHVRLQSVFFLIGIVVGGVQLGPLGTAATNGLLCQLRLIMTMENLVEWRLAGETKVLGENLPPCRFVHYKPHMLTGRESGPPRWEASD